MLMLMCEYIVMRLGCWVLYCLTQKMKTVRYFETSVTIYKPTRCNISEDSIRQALLSPNVLGDHCWFLNMLVRVKVHFVAKFKMRVKKYMGQTGFNFSSQ